MVSFKVKFGVLFIGLNVLSILFLPSTIERKVPVDKCTSCHALNASTDSWQMSSHSKINCVKCHGATNLTEMPQHSIEIYQNLMLHYQDNSYTPTIYRNLTNNVCEQCHTLDPDTQGEADCKRCHNN